MSKLIIRKKILKLRKKKNSKNCKIFTTKIIKKIKLNSKTIGGYYPVNFEVNILDTLRYLEKKKQKVSLPVIKKNNQMDFYIWSTKELLKVNKFGIPEPINTKKVIPDIIFVPLVAFDKRLYRLGYGGGYYDRYIEKNSKKKNILKIGIAYSFQKIKEVPINRFDKKLDLIITEKYIL